MAEPGRTLSPHEALDGYEALLFLDREELQFFEPCKLCGKIPRSCVEAHKHLFCNFCIQEYIGRSDSCPVDGHPLQADDIQENGFCRDRISRLMVKCENEVLRQAGDLDQLDDMKEDVEEVEGDQVDAVNSHGDELSFVGGEPSPRAGEEKHGGGGEGEMMSRKSSNADADDLPPLVEVFDGSEEEGTPIGPAGDAAAAAAVTAAVTAAVAKAFGLPQARFPSRGNGGKQRVHVAKCEWTGRVSELDFHLKTRCPLRPAECEYREYGCKWSGRLGHRQRHVETRKGYHLGLVKAAHETLGRAATEKGQNSNRVVTKLSLELQETKGELFQTKKDLTETSLKLRNALEKADGLEDELKRNHDDQAVNVANVNQQVQVDQNLVASLRQGVADLEVEKATFQAVCDRLQQTIQNEQKCSNCLHNERTTVCTDCGLKLPPKQKLYRWQLCVFFPCLIFICLISAVNFFSYFLSDNDETLRWLVVTNSSIFDVMKVIFWPWLVVWWFVALLSKFKRPVGNIGLSGGMGLLTCLFLIPAGYHFYMVRLLMEYSFSANAGITFASILIGLVVWILCAKYMVHKTLDRFIGFWIGCTLAIWFTLCSYEECLDLYEEY